MDNLTSWVMTCFHLLSESFRFLSKAIYILKSYLLFGIYSDISQLIISVRMIIYILARSWHKVNNRFKLDPSLKLFEDNSSYNSSYSQNWSYLRITRDLDPTLEVPNLAQSVRDLLLKERGRLLYIIFNSIIISMHW